MKNKFSIAMSLAVILAMLLTSLALADTYSPDNDVFSPGNQNSVSLSAAPGATVTTSAQIVVDWQGTKHLVAGSAVVFAVNTSQTTLPAGYSVGNANGTVPTPWDTTDDYFTVSSNISFTAPASAGSYSYTVKWDDTSETCTTTGADCLTGADAFTINLTVSAPPPSDTTPPSITPDVNCDIPGNAPWCKGTITVSWTVADNESTITSSSGCGTAIINSDTGAAGATITCTATSAGGTNSQSVTVYRDGTPPTISGSVSPAAAGTSWYNISTGAPTVSFSCNNTGGSGLASCTSASTLGNGANQSVTGTATDGAGNSASAAVNNINVDLVAPTIFASLNPANPASTGWYNISTGAPTVSFSCNDTGSSGLTAGACPGSHPFGEGTNQSFNATVTDIAGNTSAAAGVSGINVDLTAPALNISGAPSGSSSVCSGLPSRPTYAPSDGLSGLDGTQGDSWTTPSTSSGVGTYTYNAHATDNAGNTTSETRSYTVNYGAAVASIPFLQPINTDGSSRFKLGSTVPVKFQAMCNGASIANVTAWLYVAKGDNVPDPGVDEAISTAAATTGNLFRYDSTAQQYIFNLSTKLGYTNPNGQTLSFSAGSWTLKILLDDGTWRSVNIQLPR